MTTTPTPQARFTAWHAEVEARFRALRALLDTGPEPTFVPQAVADAYEGIDWRILQIEEELAEIRRALAAAEAAAQEVA
jgi:hypothetical protein